MAKILLILFSIITLYSSDVISPSWFKINHIEKYVNAYGNTINEAKLSASSILSKDLNKTISLSDFVVVKKEIFENKYFIKVKYINLSLLNQVKNELKKLAFKDEELQNNYLKNTKFYQDLNNSFGYFPNVELHDDYLYFKGKEFLIKHEEYDNFFANVNDSNLTLDLQDTIKYDEKFFLEINNKYNGFLTLAILQNNNLSIVFDNKKDISNMIYPNFKVSDGFSISMIDENNETKVMFIQTLCSSKKDFKSYKMLYENNTNKNNLRFSDFINEISDCKLNTKVLKVTK